MKHELTSFERVKAAVEHREADRIPFDMGGSTLTGINKNAYVRLRKHLGLTVDPNNIVIDDVMQQLALVEDDVRKLLKCDVRSVMPAPSMKSPLLVPIHTEENDYKFTDEWGLGWRMPLDGGLYFDMYKAPLKHAATLEDLKSFPWNDPGDPVRFETIRERGEKVVFEEKTAYILGRQFAGIFEIATWMRGFENFLSDLVLNPGFAESLMDIILELKYQYWEKALEAAGENVMLVAEADDLGAQDRLIISPKMYRKYIKPRHKKLVEFIKSKAQNKVYIFFHCCGAISDILPDIVECGIDILNPWQVSAKGMDTKEFKKNFGKDITIWGGGCDTQRILPYGTPQQVRDETKRRIDDLAPGGGFIFTPVHNIQGDVPPDNIMAMWETWEMYGNYK
jgi:uroporphyrinogen decarboxylase